MAVITTALAAGALAACGESGDGGATGASPRDGAQDGALKFARCMRDNGVDMPDPQIDGGRIKLGPGAGERPKFDPSSPTFRAAERRCRKHLEAGVNELSPEQKAEMRDRMQKYVACMRDEGVDLPDPAADGRLQVRRDQGGPDLDSPRFRAADEACRKHLAGGDGPGVTREEP